MNYLRRTYRLLPTPLKEMLRPLVAYYRRNIAIYRLTNDQLPGFKFSGADAVTYLRGYEKSLVKILEGIVREGDVCVDVGGHMGYVTLLFAKLAGETGRVYTFEAHPSNAKQIAFNVQQNNLSSRVKVENIAVSDGKTKKLTIYGGRNNAAAEWNILGHDLNGKTTQAAVEVRATSLDEYFAAPDPVNVIKMDIEGAEGFAISGMTRLLREQRPALVIEFHNEDGWKGREELLQADYRLFDINAGQWLEEPLNHPRVYHCFAGPVEKMERWKAVVNA